MLSVLNLPERDYVMFGSLLLQIHLSVTFVRPTQGVEAIFLRHFVPWPSSELHADFYGDRSRGTPLSEALNA